MKLLRILLALLAGVGLTTPAGAQAPANRAGLVVRHGDGRVLTACVEFSEPAITGAELLLRAGLDASMEVQGEAKICSIDGEGCEFPAQSCFCQCQTLGAACTYWAYSHLIDGRWVYSQVSASAWEVRDRDVEGWAWGQGSANEGATPPIYTFDQICANGPSPATLVEPGGGAGQAEPAPSPAPSATSAPAPGPTETAAATAASERASPAPAPERSSPTARPVRPTATVEPRPTALPTGLAMGDTPAPQPATRETEGRANEVPRPGIPAGYLAFGAIALLLLAGIAWSLRR